MHRTERGFTLLELLVVLFILAVISSVVVLSFSDVGRDRTLQATVERLSLVIELARTEVTTRNETWVFYVGRDFYLFRKQDASNQWQTISTRPFQPVYLDDEVEFITYQDQEIEADDKSNLGETPLLVLYPNGEISPFQLDIQLTRSERKLSIVSDGFQRVGLVENARQS